MKIEKFVEKPSLELAEQYIKSGDYFWNSGLFVMKSSIWLDAIEQLEPEMFKQCSLAVEKGSKGW